MVRFDGCEWDTAKSAENVHQHGVRFEEACAALDDPRRDDVDDWLHNAEERRIAALCLSPRGRVLFVVFTLRSEVTRLISARAVGPAERNRYVRHAARYDAGAPVGAEDGQRDGPSRPPRRRRPGHRR
ncbi:MAG: BrnT family toxin [Chloroflexota bacterium]